MSKVLAELVTPASDRLVCHGHASLKEQLFNVAQTQLEAETPAHCATDDRGRKTVAVIKRFRFFSSRHLTDWLNNLTMPTAAMLAIGTRFSSCDACETNSMKRRFFP